MNSSKNATQGRKCPDCESVLPNVTEVFLHGLSVHKEKFDRLFRAADKVLPAVQPEDHLGWN